MADVIKNLYSATISTTSTSTVYTVPDKKFSVVKSVFICNKSTSSCAVKLIIGGINVIYDHVIKAKDTLVINDLDIPIIQGETIQVSTTIANTVSITLVGFERDFTYDGVYPYFKSNLTSLATTLSSFVNVGSDYMVRKIILANFSANDVSVTLDIGSNRLMDAFKIKSKDTLIVPLYAFLAKSNSISGFASLSSSVSCGIVFEGWGQ
ncbi:hypothetical protein SAMN05428961_104386 [Paenibacillus sp. OK060]|uniref:hypothetical protein n=1 Tax=Paenibacillus sp. OK060 TaxID=1881034 RepID=UPI00088D200D|nr:hypothetical protein [Paenibacillus sp. OK060]SDL24407.1 hypothetical protein SAMN05428961_104386 [Paenibacillus sp. OK060]